MAWSKTKIVLVVLASLVGLFLLIGGAFLALYFLWSMRGDAQAPAPASVPTATPVFAYEPFDYPAGANLAGHGEGTGFIGTWEPGGFNARLYDVFNMKPGALTYPNLATRGDAHLSIDEPPAGVSAIAGLGRLLLHESCVGPPGIEGIATGAPLQDPAVPVRGGLRVG